MSRMFFSRRWCALPVLVAVSALTGPATAQGKWLDRPLVTTGPPEDEVFEGPDFVQLADVDGDLDLDVLSVHKYDDTIAWHENVASDGSRWRTHVICTLLEWPTGVFASDVDGDGDLDVFSASSRDDTIAWHENLHGDGANWSLHPIASGVDDARSIFGADVDGDGDVDALSASAGDDTIAWYENRTGDGLPWIFRVITNTAATALSVHAADVDGDGDLDALSASYLDDTIAWYENMTGDGTAWTAHAISTATARARFVVTADVDGDGDLDALSTAGWDAATQIIRWHENLAGDGSTWSTHIVSTVIDSPRSLSAADVDADGDLDFFYTSFFGSANGWFENLAGDGSSWTAHEVDPNASNPYSIAAGDVDGDGDFDAVAATSGFSPVVLYENVLGDGSRWGPRSISASAVAVSARPADVDADGDQDVLSASGSSWISWHENLAGDGASWSTRAIAISGNLVETIFAADVDGDGDVDVLSGESGEVRWYERSGDGSYWTPHVVASPVGTPKSITAADVDGDGDLDALAASMGNDTVSWYENLAGDGSSWSTHVITSTADGVWSAVAGDLDGDGDLDVLAAAAYADTVTWHENVGGDGTSWSSHSIGSPDSPFSVAVADVDGDGDLDALSASRDDDTIAWYENLAGDGTAWLLRVITTSRDGPRFVDAVDMDGDGDVDALSSTRFDGRITWHENVLGDGSSWHQHFIAASIWPTRMVSVGDLDGDADLDVVSAANLAWYENGPADASATFRTAGTNPASYDATPPVLGGTFTGTVDVGGTSGHASALLVGYANPHTFQLTDGQAVLVDITDPRGELLMQPLLPGPLAAFAIAVPNDMTLCGLRLSTQAIHLGGGVHPLALSNAQDLVVGR